MKDPAFLFYPGDYLSETMGMTMEEKGAYVELMILQYNRGHMTLPAIKQTVGKLWEQIMDKFTIDESGHYYLPDLEERINKRKKYTASRANNRTGRNQYSKTDSQKSGHMLGHMTSHMVNVNENRNRDGTERGSDFMKPTFEEVQAFCRDRNNNVNAKQFYDYYEAAHWVDKAGRKVDNWKQKVISWEGGYKGKPEKLNPQHQFMHHEYDVDALEKLFDPPDLVDAKPKAPSEIQQFTGTYGKFD